RWPSLHGYRPFRCLPLRELFARESSGFLDLFLEVENRLNQLLRPGRTARNIDIHGDEPVDSLDGDISIKDPTAGSASAHGNTPLRFRHLQPDALKYRNHMP